MKKQHIDRPVPRSKATPYSSVSILAEWDLGIETRKVKCPECPGGFMVINAQDFEPGVHELFDTAADDAATNATSGPLPAGCEIVHAGGPWFWAHYNRRPLKDPNTGEAVRFRGRQAAIDALLLFLRERQAAESGEV